MIQVVSMYLDEKEKHNETFIKLNLGKYKLYAIVVLQSPGTCYHSWPHCVLSINYTDG
jgi:hypothetical protein